MVSIVESMFGIIATGVIGIIVYAWQEKIKRDMALVERRQELYENLIRNLVELLTSKSGDERSERISKIEKGWLFASDNVLRASYKYLEIYDRYWADENGEVLEKIRTDSRAREEFGESIARIFLAMRHDLRPTELKPDEAAQHVKIYEWGIISKS